MALMAAVGCAAVAKVTRYGKGIQVPRKSSKIQTRILILLLAVFVYAVYAQRHGVSDVRPQPAVVQEAK